MKDTAAIDEAICQRMKEMRLAVPDASDGPYYHEMCNFVAGRCTLKVESHRDNTQSVTFIYNTKNMPVKP